MIKFLRDKNFIDSKVKLQRLINDYLPNPSLINRLTEEAITKLEKELKNIDLGGTIFKETKNFYIFNQKFEDEDNLSRLSQIDQQFKK